MDRPIRVLHVIQGKHFGGAEQVVLTLVKNFDPDRVAPFVLCLSDGLLLEKLQAAGIPHALIPMGAKTDIIGPLLKTIRYIGAEGIDIVHTHTVRSNLVGRLAAFLSRRRCVTHLHSPILRDFADLRRGKINEVVDSLTRPLADYYIAVSHSLRREMESMGFSRPIVTIHNALDLERWGTDMAAKPSGTGIRGRFGISPDVPVLALIALLRPRKGVHVMIEAMKTVAERFPNARLLIVGSDDISEDPGYGTRLREMGLQMGIEKHIIFTGFLDDIPSVLKTATLMVLPSLFGEGLPMVVLEAMASGVPVVASRVEGIPEVIEDGVHGLLVEPGRPEVLARKILLLLENPDMRRDLAKAAMDKVFSEMSGRQQAADVEGVYRKVLGR
jgi:glycosyltransferase involved in cell wall biosynthesis